MTLSEIMDWMMENIDCPQWFLNAMTKQVDKCIALYNINGSAPRIAIGGLDNTSYTHKTISILVHWGKNPIEAEAKAQEVYDLMLGKQATINGKRVIMFDMRSSAPISVGTDSEGIFEFVIEVNILYER